MIVDASVVIDAIVDSGPRGAAARAALTEVPPSGPLIAPGHFAFEVLSGLNAVARRPRAAFTLEDLADAIADAAELGIRIEATPWTDVIRGWELSQQSMTYADAVYVADAERHRTTLLTSDARLQRSGSGYRCDVRLVDGSTQGG